MDLCFFCQTFIFFSHPKTKAKKLASIRFLQEPNLNGIANEIRRSHSFEDLVGNHHPSPSPKVSGTQNGGTVPFKAAIQLITGEDSSIWGTWNFCWSLCFLLQGAPRVVVVVYKLVPVGWKLKQLMEGPNVLVLLRNTGIFCDSSDRDPASLAWQSEKWNKGVHSSLYI